MAERREGATGGGALAARAGGRAGSAGGAVVGGGPRVDLAGGAAVGRPGGGVGPAVPLPADEEYLHFTGMVNGAERWASTDGAMVQYRAGQGTLTFHAWKK